MAKLIFLGTGASTGVPVIGCNCKVCKEKDPKNMRLRSGFLLSFETQLATSLGPLQATRSVNLPCFASQPSLDFGVRRESGILTDLSTLKMATDKSQTGFQGKTFVIDAGPDFREQALRYKIGSPDALFLTHTHYDHIGGLEEFRAFSYHTKIPIPCYLSQSSFESIQKLYYYLFTPMTEQKNMTAQFDFHVLEGNQGKVQISGKDIDYFSYVHGGMNVLGYKFGRLGIVTDIKEYSNVVTDALDDIDILILSATCLKHSHVHMTVDEAIAFSKRVGAKKTYFVHLSHEIEYHQVRSSLPEGISLAYDGLEIEYMW